jgi:hypothetical protein
MTRRNISLNAFALDAPQGRTREPLNTLGEETLVKLANADTDGAVSIFQRTIQPPAGPPLHRHANEDEWFYVLEGEIARSKSTVSQVLFKREVRHSHHVAPFMHAKILATSRRKY